MPGCPLYEISPVISLLPCPICEVRKLILPSRSTARTKIMMDVELPDAKL